MPERIDPNNRDFSKKFEPCDPRAAEGLKELFWEGVVILRAQFWAFSRALEMRENSVKDGEAVALHAQANMALLRLEQLMESWNMGDLVSPGFWKN